jgi:flagellar hook protein FlgE
MYTSVSGMSAQADRLSALAENVANVNTDGYKRVSTEFASMLLNEYGGNYESGSVLTTIRNDISGQGSLISTSSATDLAVGGNGFFVVAGADGTPYLTRAGNFVPNANGELVNAAGFRLMGYPVGTGGAGGSVNSYDGLQTIALSDLSLRAAPTTSGVFTANLPSGAEIVASADLPSANAAGAKYTAKSSLTAYDNLGTPVTLDVYYSKTADNTWEVAVYNHADANASGGFPYSAAALSTQTLAFDPSNGQLTGASAKSIDIPVPNGATLNLDLSQMSQLSTDYTVISASVNGNAPSGLERVDIGKDGVVTATYQNGTRVPVYQIPLAHVASADMMRALPGNVFQPTAESGDVQIGKAQQGGLGDIVSGALEQSTVDLASELTSMIDSQRSYTANSKVFQTGADLMDVLVNLKR